MTINNKTMADLERKAALSLTDTERAELTAQMNAVLSCLDVLRTCPDCPPAEPSATCTLRTDQVLPSADRAAVLTNAPETDGTFFLVPRTVE
ncbi:MAG: aspartyl/glutamyl-tRNA amidotransferase subunit C [Oscillospiraceae bacterium]|nr:aspartyl/glutamyl-tRNA amidotransferase subunit C [Oscillospiraceae bacterium]